MKSMKKSMEMLVLSLFETRVAALGFKRSQQSFRRKRGGAKQSFHVAFRTPDESDVAEITISLAVRIDAVETLVNDPRDDLSKAVKASTATLGAELGGIMGRQQLVWGISSSSHAESVVDEVVALLEKEGMPYLESHLELQPILSRFASPEPIHWHKPIGGRAIRLPVIYALLGDKERASQEFVTQYAFLKREDDATVRGYPALVRHICTQLQMPSPL